MNTKIAKSVFNLGVVLSLAVGLGTLLNALPPVLGGVGALLGLLMVGVGYAMMRGKL